MVESKWWIPVKERPKRDVEDWEQQIDAKKPGSKEPVHYLEPPYLNAKKHNLESSE